SPDGARWAPAKLPSGLATGPLTEVAVHGDVLVAIGTGSAVLASADGGTTWTPQVLGADVTATAVTATPNGFVVAASTSKGDGAVLASADGVTWSRLQVPGLSGPGDQRFTALTSLDSAVIATGTTSGARAESPVLWRAPVPK
ncbi:MAG: WD40/YVTN/BNR-like repeat-containing protein, partial [Spirillospora sp.]